MIDVIILAIPENTRVWINTPTSGCVISMAGTPRSYIVETPTGQLQRNRHQVLVDPRDDNDSSTELEIPDSSERETTESAGRHRIISAVQYIENLSISR